MATLFSHWLVAVPNDAGSEDATLDKMANATVAKLRGCVEISWFKVPKNMKIGTLDSLMALSDDLVRMDAFLESVVKKVERQLFESAAAAADFARQQAAAAKAAGGSSDAGRSFGTPAAPPTLSINNVPVTSYLRGWQWDVERFDSAESLPDLSKRLLQLGEKIDADIRGFVSAYSERKQALAAMARRQTGTLMVVSLEDTITPEVVKAANAQFFDTEYLSTQVIVIPKTMEATFLATYESLDADSVPYGPAGNRESVRGSPVVPNSACRLLEDKEGYVLYTVLILKKFKESFVNDARNKKFPVREFVYHPEAAGSGIAKLHKMEHEVQEALSHLQEQCARKFGDSMSIWMHLKAIRVFVEAVLRYGLPVNFVCALMKPGKGADAKVHELLHVAYASLGGGGLGGDEESSKKASSAGFSGDDFHPYVYLPFNAPGHGGK